MKPDQPLSVDEMIDKDRKDTLAFAKNLEKTHSKKHGNPSGVLVDDTPPNLKKLMEVPGAFFNKRRRPIPLGTD